MSQNLSVEDTKPKNLLVEDTKSKNLSIDPQQEKYYTSVLGIGQPYGLLLALTRPDEVTVSTSYSP